MAKFCGKCGSPLDENGQCPKCNVNKALKKRTKSKKSLMIILPVIFVCIAVIGVAYANHAGFINLPFLQGKEDDSNMQVDSSDSQASETAFSPETVYASVLKTYKDAFVNNFYSNSTDEWDEKNEYDISKIRPEIRRDFGGIEQALLYCYYDISNDGIPELIIGIGNENSQHIIDMMGYENGEVKRLFSLWSFTVRGAYSINANGYICFYGSGGALYSGETYYLLKENSASPEEKADFTFEYEINSTNVKYYSGHEDNQHEITESEYNTTVSQFGEKIDLKWSKLCESKVYEAEFSTRGSDGIIQGYQRVYVTSETKDEFTLVYEQTGKEGYPTYVGTGTTFKCKKSGEVSDIKWTDGSGNEFSGTVAYHDNCFTLTYKTNSPDSSIQECTGADLYFNNSNDTDTSSASTPSNSVTTTTSPTVSLTSDEMWQTIVTNKWVDEDGKEMKFTKNITYYKLKPDAIHTTYDYYMGTLSTTNSKGYYYGHYHITDDNELRIEFSDWPDGDASLLSYDVYEWDSTLKKENSWCMTSDGTIKFSQGDNEFCGKTFHH